ncbi:hypothetical protein LCGC14_2942580, partial [marine sediment metagenome]
ADESVRYVFSGSAANVLHTDSGPVIQLFRREAAEPDDPFAPPHEDPAPDTVELAEVFVSFDGANAARPVGVGRAETVYNYFVGDEADWRTNVPAYQRIVYPGLYDGIDLHTWGRRNSLKYEFHVAPGADYTQVQVSFEGIAGLSIDAAGALHVQTELGELIDDAPYIYQEIDGQRVEVAGAFSLVDADTYRFSVTGAYDPSEQLIIDPLLIWGSFLGGNDADYGYAIAADATGNALIAGWMRSPDFPTPGDFDTSHNGDDHDAFVAKVSGSGELLWTSFLGGSDDDFGYAIAADAAGNALITGRTYSSDFPTPGGFNTDTGGAYGDAFVAKVSGAGALLWSSVLGGTHRDQGSAIAADAAGNALIAGTTASSDFPTP